MGANRTYSKRSSRILIHLLVWLVLLCLPLFLTRPDRPMVTTAQYYHYILTAASFMVVFYVNFLWLISRHLFEHRMGRFLLGNILLIVVVEVLMIAISKHIMPPPGPRMPPPGHHGFLGPLRFLLGNTWMYILVVAASVAVKMTMKWNKTEAERLEAEQHFAEAQLQNLKSQINPHFLFNTLNNIYSLIQSDPDRAQQAVHDLSRTLRYVLYESSKPSVSLRDEVAFLDDYIALMRMRLPSSVRVEVEVPAEDDEVMGKEVAPLLFISLVENAFKHGVAPGEESHVSIELRGQGNAIVCHTTNSNHPKTDSDRSGSGIGLDNLRKRLELIYPGRHTLSLNVEGGEFDALLEIRDN